MNCFFQWYNSKRVCSRGWSITLNKTEKSVREPLVEIFMALKFVGPASEFEILRWLKVTSIPARIGATGASSKSQIILAKILGNLLGGFIRSPFLLLSYG